MGRYAQAQRRGTVGPGATVGGLSAPDRTKMDVTQDLGSGEDANFKWTGSVPSGVDGMWLDVSDDNTTPDIHNANVAIATLTGSGFVLIGGWSFSPAYWKGAWTIGGVIVSPFSIYEAYL